MKKLVIPILVLFLFGLSKTAVPPSGKYSNRPFEIKKHNINQVEMCVSNYGKFGQTEAGNAGLWWPRGSGCNYIFGAGPWFGIIDSLGPNDFDTLVTIGYGPHGGETEYAPGKKGMSPSDPNAIIFMYPTNWPPPPDVFPMAPQEIKSHQDSWCVYNDLDPNYHVAGDTRPIGLEVYQTVYAWNLSTTQDIIFIRYEVKNVTDPPKTLKHCYFGICTDNDIGNEADPNQNDIISGIVGQWYVIDGESLWVDNVGYQWQNETEPGWDSFPGAIAFDYLQSPWDLKPGQDKDEDGIPDEHERDSAYFATSVPDSLWDVDGDGTPDWRDPSEIPQMGMTAFKRFTLNLEPNKDNERYITLQGYNFKTLVYEPYDTVPPSPDDQRFLQCSGPFELPPESIAIITVGIMLTYWDHENDSRPDTAIAKIDRQTQYIYDMNWLLPGPPPPPTLTCVPGDKKVTLIWDNIAETTPDPYYQVVHTADPTSPVYDPYYLEYDFEGYRVWKSLTGKTGSWELLASYDLANGIKFEDVSQPESIRLIANDTGLVHSFVDNNVRNGFNYYYAVTSFDYNYVKTIEGNDTFPRPIWFESGQVSVTAAPRSEPANLVNGTSSKFLVSGNPLLLDYAQSEIVHPLAVENDSFYIHFDAPRIDSIYLVDTSGTKKRYRPRFICSLLDHDLAPLDSGSYYLNFGERTIHEFIPYKGIITKLTIISPNFSDEQIKIFDSIEVTGTYPSSNLEITPVNFYTAYGAWAYRGNDYEVIWKAIDGVVKTVTIIDKMVNDTIPYTPFKNTEATAGLAMGWCFTNAKSENWTPSETLKLSGGPPNTTKYLYLNGALIALNKGSGITERPSDGDIWTLVASSNYTPAPVCCTIKFKSTMAQLRTDTTITLNVKVVPNPYIVHNEWQQSSLIRRLKFINLPGECTIRIFNLNGELIKTIVHKETFTGSKVLGDAGGDEWWDLLSENKQLVASGVYIFHIQSKVGEQVGKFAIIR
uniref:T9SS type A sorting domain-containing protein n=1 Tax=candidate division WOR-3 bacterium TaxID=2052148 RepID=A0A7C4TBU0_UNCW3